MKTAISGKRGPPDFFPGFPFFSVCVSGMREVPPPDRDPNPWTGGVRETRDQIAPPERVPARPD